MAGAKFEIEKFTGQNDFVLWKVKMKAVLMQQGAWRILKDGKPLSFEKLPEKEAAKMEELEYKAYSTLLLYLSDRVLREVQKEETALDVWVKLESLYATRSTTNRLHLKNKLLAFKISESKSLLEQLEEFHRLLDDLEAIEEKMKDEDKALMLLHALPRSYVHFKEAILLGRETKVSYEEVYQALKLKEVEDADSLKLEEKGAYPVPESLYTKGNDKKFPSTKKKFGKKTDKEKVGGFKETRSCHHCKKPGHIKKDCFAWKRKQAAESAGPSRSDSDYVQEVEEKPPQALNIMEKGEDTCWILDSGCSFHMCPHEHWFESLNESDGSVVLGNNQVCCIKGIGSVRLRMKDGSVVILNDVRLIPDVKRNLISLGLLDKKGCKIETFAGKTLVKRGDMVLLEGVQQGILYYLNAVVVRRSGDVNVVKSEPMELWHERLGHPGDGSIKELIRREVISGATDRVGQPCEDCILGKAKKLPFPKGKHTSTAPLDYVHSDLWGPAPVSSLGGGRYYMSVIDDFSRKMWVFILKEKSEALSKFKEWCIIVEREKGCVVKCLRTDNGLEFLSKEFEKFCHEKGIKRHRTVPLNPQQNGVAERANRTIMERVRSMLLASGMEKKFWAEAVSTAVKLINKCPSSSINSETPDFRWYGSYGQYIHLRPFGCKAFAYLKQSKLDARAVRCVMIGYQDGVKGYRLWCIEPGNCKVVISRDVTFIENDMPFKKSMASISDNSDPDANAGVQVESHSEESDSDSDSTAVEADNADDLSGYQLARDRARRTNIRPPSRFVDSEMLYFALCVAEEIEFSEPGSYKEAMECKESDKWLKAMIDEIDSLIKNGTWILVDKVEGRKLISCKWIFKKKIESADNEQIRFKARLVARGFTQEHGIDYNEVFSPVVKHASIRVLLAVVAKLDWELEQLDVKTAFLHGDLEETIYMCQPEGFVKSGMENKVCLLKKSLYGLKQASRQWHRKFDNHVLKNGFIRSKYDECVYIKKRKGVPVAYLLLYVDDMLVAGSSKEEIQRIKDDLSSAFDMKDLGGARRILGMNIMRNRQRREIWLNQTDYISRVVRRFRVGDSKATATPLAMHFKLSVGQAPKDEKERLEMESIPYANIVGSVMYAMIGTRPDVAQAISTTSRYMSNFGKEHWSALKWILRYLKGAGDFGILYKGVMEYNGDPIIGYCDSDYAGSVDTRKSQSGYVFTLFGAAVSWKSGLQSVVALSSTEAEYIALTSAVKESSWLRGIAGDFGVVQQAIPIGCDNNGAISLAKHQVYHERSKHIDVRLHFIREEIEKGRVRVFKVATADNPADMLTKPLPREKFELCMKLIGMCREKSELKQPGGDL